MGIEYLVVAISLIEIQIAHVLHVAVIAPEMKAVNSVVLFQSQTDLLAVSVTELIIRQVQVHKRGVLDYKVATYLNLP